MRALVESGRVGEGHGSLGGSRRVLEGPGLLQSVWRVQDSSERVYNVLVGLPWSGRVWRESGRFQKVLGGSWRIPDVPGGSFRVWEN